MPPTVLSTDQIREILVRRIDQQKQAVGIVVDVIEPNGRRVIAYGNLAKGDSRKLDGDTIFEIGSISKVFTSAWGCRRAALFRQRHADVP